MYIFLMKGHRIVGSIIRINRYCHLLSLIKQYLVIITIQLYHLGIKPLKLLGRAYTPGIINFSEGS